MSHTSALQRKVSVYLKKGQLVEAEENKRFERPFLLKARKNMAVATILLRVSQDAGPKKALGVPFDFEMYDWVAIVSYYSMYISALAALARVGIRSKSHSATITSLDFHYVHGGSLEPRHLDSLIKAHSISEELITKLFENKSRREIAQYEATSEISRENALVSIEDADEFISQVEEALA